MTKKRTRNRIYVHRTIFAMTTAAGEAIYGAEPFDLVSLLEGLSGNGLTAKVVKAKLTFSAWGTDSASVHLFVMASDAAIAGFNNGGGVASNELDAYLAQFTTGDFEYQRLGSFYLKPIKGAASYTAEFACSGALDVTGQVQRASVRLADSLLATDPYASIVVLALQSETQKTTEMCAELEIEYQLVPKALRMLA